MPPSPTRHRRPRGRQETVELEAAPESSRRALHQMSNLRRPTGRSPKEVMSDRAKRVAKARATYVALDGLGDKPSQMRRGRLHAEYTAALSGSPRRKTSPHTADTQGRKHPSNSRMQGQTHAASNTASSNNLQQHSNTARQAGAPATQANQSPPCVGSQNQASAQGGAGTQTPTATPILTP